MKPSAWTLFTEALVYCFRERRALVRFGAIPFGIITVTTVLEPNFLAAGVTLSQWIIGMLLVASQILICVPMIVSWYRMIILGKDEAARTPLFAFGPRETRLLGWQVAVTLIGLAAIAAAGAIIAVIYYAGGESVMAITLCVILGIAALFAILAVINRLSFVFVLSTTDQPVSFRGSWEMSRGTTWPLLWALMYLISVESLVGSVASLLGGAPAAGLQAAATVLTFAAMATLFAQAYLRIVVGPAASAPPDFTTA